jgi:hypothetical protein
VAEYNRLKPPQNFTTFETVERVWTEIIDPALPGFKTMQAMHPASFALEGQQRDDGEMEERLTTNAQKYEETEEERKRRSILDTPHCQNRADQIL